MNKQEKIVKLYPIYYAFTADLVFYIPIDTLFLSHVKNLSASQITFMNMFGLLVCTIFQKPVIKIAKKIGNGKSVRLGMFLLLISTIVLCFSNSMATMLIYRFLSDLSLMFSSMIKIIIKHNLMSISKPSEYVKTINSGNILYGIVTLFTTLVSGYLYNFNNYLPLYISIIIFFVMFIIAFYFDDAETDELDIHEADSSIHFNKVLLYIFLSSALFVSIFRVGQNNSKLLLQYGLESSLPLAKVTIYLTYIMFASRIVRILGNVFFRRLYSYYKADVGNYMAIAHFICYALLVLGNYSNVFIIKVILMSLGYFIILAIRDPYQTYIDDIILKNTTSDIQQQAIVKCEVYRKILQLVINLSFSAILLKYEFVITEVVLLILAFIEIFINYRMVNLLKKNS